MDSVSQRIGELIEELAISNKDFAEKVDVAPAIISHVLSGRNKASLHLIQQITNVYTNVNLGYLLHGNGQLFNTNSEDPTSTSTPNGASLPAGTRVVSEPMGAPIHRPSQDEPASTNLNPEEVPSDSAKEELTNVYSNVNTLEKKEIERIVIFYSDKSFEEYRP